MDEMKTEKRWFLPCCKPKCVYNFIHLGERVKRNLGKCENCTKYDIEGCKIAGKPIRATITYRIEVGE